MDFQDSIAETFRKTSFKTPDSGIPRPELRGGRLFIPPELLNRIAREAFRSLSFYFRESHLELLAARFNAPEVSGNDRLVIGALLENALAAARGRRERAPGYIRRRGWIRPMPDMPFLRMPS